ncbi:MAG TPA: SDR family oxidoreductase [Steroidobacteraceae bacterium]|nr:SDR family oxidoreductase [Steroidobacteraceae bacterium]
MQLSGNTILITGGGSGIGRALAEAFHALGNQVVIAGRRQELLAATAAANPGMKSVVLDIESAAAIRKLAGQVRDEFPSLNVVVHNAGIMRTEALQQGALADAEATVATNLLGPIRLTAALLPVLSRQPRAAIMTVSSGLAFVPLANTPTYCATKAALHSYTQSLRYQLRETAIQVIELIPPYVQTELMGPRQASDPNAMPLKDFIAETVSILRTSPEATEICVERVKPLRFAEAGGAYEAFFRRFNDAAITRHADLKRS